MLDSEMLGFGIIKSCYGVYMIPRGNFDFQRLVLLSAFMPRHALRAVMLGNERPRRM